jgi:hypothetical protein
MVEILMTDCAVGMIINKTDNSSTITCSDAGAGLSKDTGYVNEER